MELKEIKANLSNFGFDSDVIIEDSTYYLAVDIEDVTKRLVETYIPEGLIEKRTEIFLPNDVIVNRFLFLKILAPELERIPFSHLIFEENLILNKRTKIELKEVDDGMKIADGMEAGIAKLVEVSAKLKALKRKVRLVAND